MAIKATCSVTLSAYRDTQSVTRYYKLQSSTAAAPTKPTTNPPSGWTDTEPSYTSGSTNSLYFCDLTIFSDGTWAYSAVSKSSSYEAAKEAYNKAVNAESRITSAEIKIDQNTSAITLRATKTELNALMEGNLIVNGFGLNKNNYNFSHWTFDGVNKCDGYPSFKFTGTRCERFIPQYMIPIDKNKTYEFKMSLKGDSSKKLYLGWDEYDIDGKHISANYCMGFLASTTTLAKELKDGDTVVYLTSASGWTSTTYTHQLGLIFWNYKDSTGYQYPAGVYSRNAWIDLYTFDNVDKTNNTITLKSAWNHGTFPAGTQVSQSNSSGHKYFNYSNKNYPSDWTETSWTIGGEQTLYTFQSSRINQAAKYMRFIILHNFGESSAISTTQISKISLVDVTTKNTLTEEINRTQEAADLAQETASSAESLIEQLADSISMLVTDGNGTSLMTQTETGWTFSTSELQKAVDATSEGLDKLVNNLDNTNSAVDALQQSVNDLGTIGEYIHIGRYDTVNKRIVTDTDNAESSENIVPCILLGESDSNLKLLITNTQILFMEGSALLASMDNHTMTVENAFVEKELRQGEFVWQARSNGNLGLIWKGVGS